MLSKPIVLTIAAGLAAGIIFSVAAYSSAGGLLLIYLPSFPLLLIGFALGAKRIFTASLAAFATVALFTDTSNAAFFAAFTIFPALYFVHKALLWRGEETHREWYPMLAMLAELTTIAALFFLIFSVMATSGGHNGLQAVLAHELASDMSNNASPEFQSAMKWLTGEGSFLLFAMTGWSWVLMIYAFAAFAHSLLEPNGLALRPSLAIEPILPLWLLGLLVLNGALALLGHGTNRFIAETVFLLLLLPYFLAGLARMHRFSLRWHNRRLWLVLFYIILLFQAWIIVLVALSGLLGQLAEILDKRREIG
jgi:hypothetical protein